MQSCNMSASAFLLDIIFCPTFKWEDALFPLIRMWCYLQTQEKESQPETMKEKNEPKLLPLVALSWLFICHKHVRLFCFVQISFSPWGPLNPSWNCLSVTISDKKNFQFMLILRIQKHRWGWPRNPARTFCLVSLDSNLMRKKKSLAGKKL